MARSYAAARDTPTDFSRHRRAAFPVPSSSAATWRAFPDRPRGAPSEAAAQAFQWRVDRERVAQWGSVPFRDPGFLPWAIRQSLAPARDAALPSVVPPTLSMDTTMLPVARLSAAS